MVKHQSKILTLASSVLLLGSVLGCTDGPIDTTSTDLQQPDHYYEIDGWGTNPDIYEFTPRSNPKYTCLIIAEKTRGVFCIPKPEEDRKSTKQGYDETTR